jgi:segregation and condensation protein A
MSSPQEIRVRTPVFEGPIDLLVTLAQRHELDLNQVRLADLTAEYLRSIETADPAPAPDEMAAFLVVGARLLALKAAALLPAAEPKEDEEDIEAWEEHMRGRMQEYERFKAAATELMRRHQEGGFSFTSAIEAEIVPGERVEINRDSLVQAFQTVLDRLPPPAEVAFELRRYSLAEEVEVIRSRTRGGERVSFNAIFDDAQSRLHAVVIFLALLELVRSGEVRLRQRGVFDAIEIQASTTAIAEAGE